MVKTVIEDLLKKRTNIRFFSSKIPEKKIIQEILEKAHNLTPYKNNFMHFDIDVYGPECVDQKKNLVLTTICNGPKKHYRQKNLNDADLQKLKQGYQDWLDFYAGDKTKSYILFEKWQFNEQVTAPYLLAYYLASTKFKESQKQNEYFTSGRMSEMYVDKVSRDEFNMQAGMHSMVTSMLALEQGLDVSFCKCYFYNKVLHTDILAPRTPAFLLGIGYKDESKSRVKRSTSKPQLNEVLKWQ